MFPTLIAISGAAIAVQQAANGSPAAAGVCALLFAVLALLLSPLAFPRPLAAAEAQRRSAADGGPVIYWRPGCQFCLRLRLRLRLRLGRAGRGAHWVDIWSDPDGAAAVRAVTGGDETVPTVVLAGQPYVNPDPAWLRRQLTGPAGAS